MSKDRTTWIKIFLVNHPQEHSGGYTVYKVVETSFPAQSPDLASTRAAWRRWSQIKVLHRELERIHKTLYLSGTFPALPATNYFNRKEANVIEERRLAIQDLLEFCAGFPVLYTSRFFQDLFKMDGNLLEADIKSESSISDTQSLMSISDLAITPSQDLSIDRTPTLTPTPASQSSSPSPSLSLNLPPSSPIPPSSLPLPALSSSSPPTMPSPALAIDPPTLPASTSNSTLQDQDTSPVEPRQEVEGLRNYEDGDGGIPAYITEAARIIADALSLEAEEKFEESITAYRSAIGRLLSSVQGDPDVQRRAAVKKRVAQYISKAEQLVQRELETRSRKESRRVTGIPHLQLFGQLNQLRDYKVINIFDKKIILAENFKTKQQVIFKVLQKSPAVYKKSKTSLLPINISYMVGLVKYFETDDAVYLMLEYCPAGKLWDVVQPLVNQQLQQQQQQEQDEQGALAKPVPGLLKTSESFVLQRQASYAVEMAEDSDSEAGNDISFVHAENASLLVISADQIDHYQCPKEDLEDEEECLNTSREILKDLADQTFTTHREEDIMSRLTGLEEKIRSHLQGNLDGNHSSSDHIEDNHSNSDHTEDNIKHHTEPNNEAMANLKLEDDSRESEEGTERPERKISFQEGLESGQAEVDRPVPRPRLLRKLSEVLPQCPDPNLQDSTFLPDRVVRLWAAELAQVLSSLHYREIIIRDLNPGNVLLDSTGHVKLTYQCEWVSIDRELSQAAVEGHFVAPEVITVSEISPAADWWSYGAILLLLYTGRGPSSLIPTGLDSSIPLSFPPSIPAECQNFISSLLEVYPVNRLGAGSTGSLDIRNHPYFKAFNWNTMAFLDQN